MKFARPLIPVKPNTLVGILLVCLAIAALLFWEAAGREMFLMESVLVAKADIEEGSVLSADLFRITSVPGDSLTDGALTPKSEAALSGKVAALPILSGAQLSARLLRDPDEIQPDTSSFVLKNEWIALCTSALRRGDKIELRYGDGAVSLGVYGVAYVKDAEGREVTDTAAGLGSFRTGGEADTRANPSAPIHHIEIECEWNDYQKILTRCREAAGASLIIVRKEVPSW